MHSTSWTRRRFIAATVGSIAGTTILGACGNQNSARTTATGANEVLPDDRLVAATEALRRRSGALVRSAELVATPAVIDVGVGDPIRTWAYGDQVPGTPLRFNRGDIARVTLRNELPEPTTIHWHGLALRNDMDGVPDLTQPHITSGSEFVYEFAVPDPGTYWLHPHSGLQLDRGLYAPFIVEDPDEPNTYDDEVILVIDDWTDEIGPSPAEVLAGLRAMPNAMEHSMSMDDTGMDMEPDPSQPLGTDGGDVDYPLQLVNGRGPDDPATIRARPGQRLRLRIINAAADTAYRVAVAEHRLTVTHTDGFPVEPVDTDCLLITMGERHDVVITVGDGAFEILARPEAKTGVARAVLRSASGAVVPAAGFAARPPLTAEALRSSEGALLRSREPDSTFDLRLGVGMGAYEWPINGRSYPDHEPIPVAHSERVRIRIDNRTPMFHPMHLHGHTFEVEHPDGRRLRKDTLAIAPMRSATFAVECDNPGQWALHCHNGYHAEAGMMTVFSYRA